MQLLTLIKAKITGTTWLSKGAMQELKKRNQLWLLPLAGAGIAVAAAFFLFMIIQNYRALFMIGQQTGFPEIVFFYALLASWALIFLIGIPFVISLIYYSKDTQALIPLPIKPLNILLAKIILLFLYILPVHFILFIPALTVYGTGMGLSSEFVVAGILNLLAGSMIPLCLAVLFVLLLMKLVNLSRYRVALEVGGMVLGLLLLVGLQIFLSRSMLSGSGSGGAVVMSGLSAVFDSLNKALPPLSWAAKSFIPGSGLIFSLNTVILTVSVVILVLLAAERTFLKDFSRQRSSSKSRIIKTGSFRVRKKIPALINREWSVLSSHSIFIFEAFGEVFTFPLLLIIFSLAVPKAIIAPLIQSAASFPYTSLIVFAALILLTTINSISCTSLSREGRNFALSLSLPLAGREHLKAKLFFHLMLMIPAYLIDVVIIFFILKIPVISLVFILPGGLVFVVFNFICSIYIDLKRPVLTWTHPQQAVKQNMNVVLGMGISLAFIALLALISFLLIKIGVNPIILGLIPLVLVGCLDLILLPRVLAYADLRYSGGLEITG